MSIPITDKFKPKNNGSFALMDAADVEMPDGTRLSDFKGGVTSVNGQTGVVNIPAINGKDGKDGKDGANGKDGVSPSITVVAITGGHRVSITDANSTITFDVMNGKDGNEGGGSSITVDATLDPNSTNPVQNKVICEQLAQAEGVLQQLQGRIPTIDTTLSQAGQAADAKAVGDAFAQARQEVVTTVQNLAKTIPTDEHINTLIDDYLSEALGGDY